MVPLHDFMKLPQCWRATNLGQDLEKAISANKVKGLGAVDKGNVEWLSLFPAFSCRCLSENTMSAVDLSALNLHCDFGWTLSARTWRLFSTT